MQQQADNSQSGFLIIKIILIIAFMVAGYILISNARDSEQGQDAIETVKDAQGIINNSD